MLFFFPQTQQNFTTAATKVNKDKHVSNFKISNQFLENNRFKKHINAIKTFNFSKLLTSGDVHPNPGPRTADIRVITYNVRGLKCRLKLKRILSTCHKALNLNPNTVICLQETHLEEIDNSSLDFMWRHKYLTSPGTNRQCG